MSLAPAYTAGFTLTAPGQPLAANLQAVVLTGGVPITQTLVSVAVVTPNIDQYDVIAITAQGGPLQVANPVSARPIPNGTKLMFHISDSGASQPIAYGSKYRPFVAPLPISTVVGKAIYMGFIYDSADDLFDLLAVANQL